MVIYKMWEYLFENTIFLREPQNMKWKNEKKAYGTVSYIDFDHTSKKLEKGTVYLF